MILLPITRGPITPGCHLLPVQQLAARPFSLHLGLVSYLPSEASKRPPRAPSLQSTAPVCELGRWLPSSGKDTHSLDPFPSSPTPAAGAKSWGRECLEEKEHNRGLLEGGTNTSTYMHIADCTMNISRRYMMNPSYNFLIMRASFEQRI